MEAVDGAGDEYLTGITASTDLPLQNPIQAAYGGGTYDAFMARIACIGAPGPVGNTLRVVRDLATATLVYSWTDVAPATSYNVRQDTVKSGPVNGLTGTAPSGLPGLAVSFPPEPLLYYRVAGVACAAEGPK